MYKYIFLILLLSCYNDNDKKVIENSTPTINLQTKDTIINDVMKKDTLTASATILSKAFAGNEVTANKLYKNKIIKVTGTIKQINVGITDKAYIVLKGVDRFTEPFCYLSNKDDAEKLKIGNSITLIGECTGLWANLIFKDCELVQTK
jgi:hypothetical protein